MEQVAKTDYYELNRDEAKNRAFFTFIGFWKDESVVPNFYNDCIKLLNSMKPGFTLLANLKNLKTPPQDIVDLFTKVQLAIIEKGVSKSAEVVDSMLVKVNVDESSDASGIQKRQFDNISDALTWLDT